MLRLPLVLLCAEKATWFSWTSAASRKRAISNDLMRQVLGHNTSLRGKAPSARPNQNNHSADYKFTIFCAYGVLGF